MGRQRALGELILALLEHNLSTTHTAAKNHLSSWHKP